MRIQLLAVICAIVLLSSCIGEDSRGGSVLLKSSLEQLQDGVTTREQVLKLLGSPSTSSIYGGEKWYYISRHTATKGILNPKLLDQKIVELEFDASGVLKSSKTYSEADIKEVDFAREKTETGGQKPSLAKQLLGNVGRFNKQAADE